MKTTFIGLGYIGLPTAIIAAKSGMDVLGVDINPTIVEKTNRGEIHIVGDVVARDSASMVFVGNGRG